jgi:pyruvate/2-oxoglutarate dehydrogenase complex dihydrolipoamide acyltransferase (E2) component
VDTKAKIALGVGGAVIALGAAVGVGALAANLAGGDTATPPGGFGQDGRAGGAGPGARGGMDTTQLAKTLATKLGVDEAKVAAALKEVMAAARPAGAPSGQPSGAPSTRPSGARNGQGGSAYLETLAKALAQKLNLDEATVLTALQEAMASQRGAGGQPTSQPT